MCTPAQRTHKTLEGWHLGSSSVDFPTRELPWPRLSSPAARDVPHKNPPGSEFCLTYFFSSK
jgi:hypothetical protein